MPLIVRSALPVALVVAAAFPAAAQGLRASPSGHYIRYGDETLLLIGDSGTQCVLQNLNLDYRQWIDDCAERGIRAIHVWALVPPRQKQDGSVIEDRYGYVYPGATPWARREGGPPAFDQLPQWDLRRIDEGADPQAHYWPRLRDLCAYAKAHEIIVGITVFFGWPKHNHADRPDWSYHPFNVLNGGHLTDPKRMTTVCQEILSPGEEVVEEDWSPDWPATKKTQWVWERFAEKLIEDTRPYGNVFFVFMDEHSYSEGNCGDHFLGFFKRRGAVWVDWEARREAVDFVFSSTFSADDKNADAVKGFSGTPAKPYMHLEGGPYEGDGVRTALWTFAIAGGHCFFHDDERQGLVTRGIMGYDPHVVGGDRNQRVRDWLGHASRLFNEHVRDLDQLSPHNELVTSGGAYCLAAPGREYVVYSMSGETFELDLAAAAGRPVSGRWYDTRAGVYRGESTVDPGPETPFRKPDAGDWVLHVVVE